MSAPLAGQIAVVTGGGSGIGRASALALAERGADVIVCGRRPGPLTEVARLAPDQIRPVVADVTCADGVAAVRDAVETAGGVNVLIHNAGTFRFTPLPAADLATARDLFELAVFAPTALTHALLPHFADPGSIVFVSSNAGVGAVPGADAYAASKAAQNSLTRTWALELADRRIRVNGVAPAAVRTDVYASNGLSPDEIAQYFAYQDARSPLGRSGHVEDVTPWIALLTDPRSAWVTGQIITLDGGLGLTAA